MKTVMNTIYENLWPIVRKSLGVCCVLVVCGCTKVLDIAPDGRLNLEDFFKDNDKTAAVLNECYNWLPVKGLHYSGWSNYPTATSDESWAYVGDHDLSAWYNNRLSVDNHPFLYPVVSDFLTNRTGEYWNRYFVQIRYCTIFIRNIDGAVVDSETNRKRWKAEAHVLRAYYMSELMKWYGEFPLNGMELYSMDYDYSNAVKNSVWEVAEAIESDCRAAIAIEDSAFPYRNSFLPSQTNMTAGDELRVNKAVAWAIMAKTYLFAAGNLHNKGIDSGVRTERWKKAYEVNKEAVTALEANDYALYETSTIAAYTPFGKAAAFYELNSTFLAPESDKETLWQNNTGQAVGYQLNSLPMPDVNYIAYWPSQELVDAFEVVLTDGSGNITASAPLLDLADPYNGTDGHLSPNFSSAATDLGYSDDNPYVNRDPRFKATITCNADIITWNGSPVEVETFVGGAHGMVIGSGNRLNTRTGYYARKFMRPGTSPNQPMKDPAWKYFRLAEVKLNFAEAAAEYAQAKGGDQSIQQEAAEQVNDIRARVGMPEISGSWVSNVANLILRVRNERRVELAFEECRFFDVRRWCDPDGDLSATDKYISAMEITKNGGTLTYNRIHVNNKTGPTRDGWQNKFLLLPILKDDVIRMQNATGIDWQNPGW